MKLDIRDLPAIYINLKKDVEKNEYMKNMLNELGFKNIIRVDASEFPPEMHLAGCSASHFAALNQVDAPFIIFEDDCRVKNFQPIIEIPELSDAVYLGISSWGRMNSHSGPFVQYKKVDQNLLRIYNMLSAHSILYLTQEYASICSKISSYAVITAEHQDIGFAEIQRYYNVYAFDDPMFYQTSSNGTDQKLSSYPTEEIVSYNKFFWKPTALY
jgi:hypothetical protein